MRIEDPSRKDRFGFRWNRGPGTYFWKKPSMDRRVFFRHMATALSGYYLLPSGALETVASAKPAPIKKAKNVIFILLSGAASHVDTFDLKEGSWLTADISTMLKPTSYDNGIRFPQGLMPLMANQLGNTAFVRSTKSWAVVHGLSQTWWMMGRNPVTGLGRISPHIGSVVSRELTPADGSATMPAFLALNSQTASTPDNGYFSPKFGPFQVAPNAQSLPGLTHPDGNSAFDRRFAALQRTDGVDRSTGALGTSPAEMAQFADNARRLMYNNDVSNVFTATAEDRNRYGNTTNGTGSGFGNACLVARNAIRSNLGTRFVQLTLGSWDHHANIYLPNANLQSMTRTLDFGLGNLMADLKADGSLDNTLIVMMGEFGRTVGALNSGLGRDHYPQQTVFFAGAGIKGPKAIGATDDLGKSTTDPGWSRQRDVRPEDVEATIYSALGIDWTKVLTDDPLGRGYEYIPFSKDDLYGPIHELWS